MIEGFRRLVSGWRASTDPRIERLGYVLLGLSAALLGYQEIDFTRTPTGLAVTMTGRDGP